MLVSLSPAEAASLISALQGGSRRPDGSLLVDIPLFGAPKPQLVFDGQSRTVAYGIHSVRLSSIEHALLKLAHEEPVSYERAQDTVWGRCVSEGNIQTVCSRVSTKLLDAGIPFSLSAVRGHVSLVFSDY